MATFTEATIQQSTSEIRKWTADFTNDLPTGITVSSGTAVHTPPSGTASSVTIANTTTSVTAMIGPLTVTGVHYLDVQATFSNSEKSEVRIAFTVNYPTTTARVGMVDLIAELRGLADAGVNDYTIAGVPYWSDAQLQKVLDKHRIDQYRMEASPQVQYTGGGTTSYTTYYLGASNWEQTTGGTAIFTVEDGDGDKVGTASWTADYARGVITFGTSQGGTSYYVTGRTYDLNAAAADVWRMKAANVAKQFDFSTDNMSVKRSQTQAQYLQMAAYYDGLAQPTIIQVYREDNL